MSSPYESGFNKGYEDAMAGRKKQPSALNMVKPLKSQVDENLAGYQEGYRIGSRDSARKKQQEKGGS